MVIVQRNSLGQVQAKRWKGFAFVGSWKSHDLSMFKSGGANSAARHLVLAGRRFFWMDSHFAQSIHLFVGYQSLVLVQVKSCIPSCWFTILRQKPCHTGQKKIGSSCQAR